MLMTVVGRVKEIWRFPVKSMQGSKLDETKISKKGIVGDRNWAMRDDVRAEVQWGKKYPQLMQCSARYTEEPLEGNFAPVEITFPDGEKALSGTERVDEKLTELIGTAASLWKIQPPENLDFYKRYKHDGRHDEFMEELMGTFAREDGEPVPDMAIYPELLVDYVAIPGTFFDYTPLQILTTASLRNMEQKNPDATWDVRRFRPNILIETDAGLTGPVEGTWEGGTVKMGAVTVDMLGPTPRCGMTMQPQGDLPKDKTILRSIVKDADQNLGAYCTVAKEGHVKVGDEVVLTPAA